MDPELDYRTRAEIKEGFRESGSVTSVLKFNKFKEGKYVLNTL